MDTLKLFIPLDSILYYMLGLRLQLGLGTQAP